MTKKSARLKPVEKLAEDKVKSATEAMVNARTTHESQEQKLSELVRYRFEYIEQFQSKAKIGMAATQLQQYQQFISQLDVAIEQQRIAVKRSGIDFDNSKTHWKHKNSHKKAINKVITRFEKQEIKAEAKTEQNVLDEHNTLFHSRAQFAKS